MRNATAKQIMETLEGLTDIRVSSNRIYNQLRDNGVSEARKGEIMSGEGKGVKIQAYGYDELLNIIAITQDGFIKQYTGA